MNQEKYIKEAILWIRANVLKEKTKLPNPYKGYVSSFGASVLQAGLIPTLAFFSAQESAKEDRSHIVKCIAYLLREKYTEIEAKADIANTALLTAALTIFEKGNTTYFTEFENDIEQAAIAMKLALRTFQFE